MVRNLGFVFGFAFVLGGTLGFVPGVTKDEMYFGIFMVNTPHNVLHIVSGTIFLAASIFGERPARLWFLTFGVLYGAIAAAGFVVGEGKILGLISNNLYDAWGHTGLALAMLLIGLTIRQKGSRRANEGVSMNSNKSRVIR
jgi:hypothetical protein